MALLINQTYKIDLYRVGGCVQYCFEQAKDAQNKKLKSLLIFLHVFMGGACAIPTFFMHIITFNALLLMGKIDKERFVSAMLSILTIVISVIMLGILLCFQVNPVLNRIAIPNKIAVPNKVLENRKLKEEQDKEYAQSKKIDKYKEETSILNKQLTQLLQPLIDTGSSESHEQAYREVETKCKSNSTTIQIKDHTALVHVMTNIIQQRNLDCSNLKQRINQFMQHKDKILAQYIALLNQLHQDTDLHQETSFPAVIQAKQNLNQIHTKYTTLNKCLLYKKKWENILSGNTNHLYNE